MSQPNQRLAWVHFRFWLSGPFGRRAGTETAAIDLQRIWKRIERIERIVGYHPLNPFENPLEIG